MLYPVISNAINERGYDQVIVNYQKKVKDNNEQDFSLLFNEAEEYNKRLTTSSIADVFSDPDIQNSSDYLSILNVDQEGTIGYISIPKIDVKIPIYHGTSAKVLQKGVGHLEGSSFPIGGETTHSILSAHRGLPSARLFTDLDQLKKGDKFYIYILDRVLTYEVDQTIVIEPSNTEPLQLQEGQDYVTLVTCTPYAVNTHRLLVRGTRVVPEEADKVETVEDIVEEKSNKELAFADIALYIGIALALMILIITIFIVLTTKKKDKHLKEKTE